MPMMPDPMPIPIPGGLKSIRELPRQRESMQNQVKVGGSYVPRFGMEHRADFLGASRGSVLVSGVPYFVMGDRLVRYIGGGLTEDVGSFNGTGHVNSDDGPEFLGTVMVDSTGGAGYVLTDSSFTQITAPYFPQARDIAVLDGYAVAVPLDGGPCVYSANADFLTWPAQNFFDAETSPDRNVSVFSWRNYLYVGGTDTTEMFVTTSNSQAAIQRVDGGSIPVGMISCHIEYGPSFVFLGKRKGNDFGFFQMGSGEAPEISNPAIEEILSGYTFDELLNAYANRYFRSGTDIVTFHLPRHCLAYGAGEWVIYKTGTDEAVDSPWIVKTIIFSNNEYLCASDDVIGVLGGLKDLDQYFAQGFDTFIRAKRGQYFRFSNLDIDCLTGQSATEKTISLSLSKDGRVWQQPQWRSLGLLGNYQRRVNFNFIGGLGTYESFCGVRIRTTSDVAFAIDGMQGVIE
jgi:hypothetical protein